MVILLKIWFHGKQHFRTFIFTEKYFFKGKNNDLEDGEEGEEGNKIVRDEELVKVLDKLLFYLRIVHSVDFYSCSE